MPETTFKTSMVDDILLRPHDAVCYPFYVTYSVKGNTGDERDKVYEEIQDWLDENLGRESWGVIILKSDEYNSRLYFQFLFKAEEDVVAFRLRWEG